MSKYNPEALLDFAEHIKKTDKNVSSAIIETVFEKEIEKLKIRERKDERSLVVKEVMAIVDGIIIECMSVKENSSQIEIDRLDCALENLKDLRKQIRSRFLVKSRLEKRQ